MAVDKILPIKLDSDIEERLVQQGFMTDAMNITVSEDGKGSSSIIKNVVGTIPGAPLSDEDKPVNNNRVVTVGTASDPQRSYIYFIVADKSSDGNENSIYQYNVATDTYRVVIKDKRLNLNPNSFVKVDVVNGDFARDGGLQTILYFTDNINPPRKINVDRAIAGDYSDTSNREFEYAINTVKAAPVYPPSASFKTDKSIDTNLFRDEAFQFATQIIYKDGEESAISPYSKLTIPTQLTVYNVNEVGFGLSSVADNVCVINPNILANDLKTSPDVVKLRILARSGNNGPFSVVDEFDMNSALDRSVNGNTVQVYNGNNEYKFFNDRIRSIVADSEVNKLFDNVPLEARGQAVSGNRLMYSNYTEGRPNVNMDADMRVLYRNKDLVRKDYVDQTDANNDNEADIVTQEVQATLGSAGVIIDLKDSMGIDDDSTIIRAGTVVSFSFDFTAAIVPGQQFDVGFQYTASGINDTELDVNIDHVEFNSVSWIDDFGEGFGNTITNDGVQGSLLFPLTPNGRLNVPKLDMQFVVPFDMPFFSEDEENLVSLFTAKLDNTTFNGTYYCRIRGTYSGQTAGGFVSANLGSGFDGPFPHFSGSYTGFTYNGGAGIGQGVTSDIRGNGPGLADFTFGFRISEGLQVGTIAADIIPVACQQFNQFQNDAGFVLAAGDGFPISVDAPQSFPINTPDDQVLNVTGGFSYDIDDFTDALSTPEAESLFESTTGYLFEKALSVIENNQASGFKAGAIHNLGVVYYDKYNRSGFVNEIGNVYVEWFNKSGDEFRGNPSDPENYLDGPAAIEIDINNNPPDWAETYQIVYPGNSSVSDFVQYSVINAYPARVKHDLVVQGNAAIPNRDIDTETKRLYVSLESLDQYRDERNTLRDYSFTEGDRLRVISCKGEVSTGGVDLNTDESDLVDRYKSASDGTIIEFDVVGVEILAKDLDNPIAFSLSNDPPSLPNVNAIPDEMTGKFIVLEASSIAGGAFGEDGEILRYNGFDWNSVSRFYRAFTNTQGSGGANESDFDYAGIEQVPSAVNHWGERCLVEIFSPKKSLENEFYYEIGESRKIEISKTPGLVNPRSHGPAFVIESGDINFRPTPCKFPSFDESATNTYHIFEDEPNKLVYKTESLESFTVSDKLAEKMWSKGRPHVKFENATTFRRFNGITYSDAFAEDVDRLSLSSFNATLANFYSFDSQYGACNYIANYGSEQRGFDELVAVQENKFSKTPVNKSIITDAANLNNVALSTNVLVTTTYYSGDYGCGNHPESVLVQDGDVYFFDRSRKKVLRFSGGQLVPISDQGVASIVNDATNVFNSIHGRDTGKIISGYDPDDDVYYITFVPDQPLFYFSVSTEDGTPPPIILPIYSDFDYNDDGLVNIPDLLIFQGAFDTEQEVSIPTYEEVEPGVFVHTNSNSQDFNFDGIVSAADLLAFQFVLGTESAQVSDVVVDGVGTFKVPIGVSANFSSAQFGYNVSTGEVVSLADLAEQQVDEEAGPALGPGITLDVGYPGFTLSYNAEGRFWQSRNSFFPDIYVNQDNNMYTAKYVNDAAFPGSQGDALLFHKHSDNPDKTNRCQFYSQITSPSFIEVVSNASPSSVKVYDAVSYEGEGGDFGVSVKSSDESISNIEPNEFFKKEGTFYASIGRDESPNSTTQIRYLGLVTAIEGEFLRINQHPTGVVGGSYLKYFSEGNFENIGVEGTQVSVSGDIVSDGADALVQVSGPVSEDVIGSVVVMDLPSKLNGDAVRGHFATIKLTSNSNDKYELFCVNAHISESNLHHIN